MSRSKFVVITLASIFGLTLACSRQSPSPTAPTSHSATAATDGTDGSTLKADPPVLVSPLNDAQMPDNPTLTAKATKMDFDGRSPEGLFYRIEVYNAAGSKIIDTGLLAQPTYQITQKLEYQQRHTWRVRAEYQGRVSPWSATGSFI